MTTPHRARALLTADDPARHFDTAHVDATELRAIPTTHPARHRATGSSRVMHQQPRQRPGRRRTRVVAGGLLALTVGGTAAAAGFLRPAHPEIYGISCVSDDGIPLWADYREGSPIEACRAAWHANGTAVPTDLVVFEQTDALLGVAPRSLVPAGAVVVPEPSGPDPRVLELADALGDDSRGMSFSSECHAESEVRSKVRGHLTRLGLNFRIDETTGEGECAVALLHPTEPAVTLSRRTMADIAQNADGEQDPTGPDYRGFDQTLDALAARPPATLAQIESAVALAATTHGVSADSYEISTVASPVGTAPRLYVINGGRTFLHVYIPTP
jgi:hypothetical protein